MTVRMGVIPVTAFMQNCRVIAREGGHDAIAVDPGDRAHEIACMVEDAGLTLAGILLTHAHLDHIGAAADLQELTKATIYGPCAGDQALIDAIPRQSQGLGLRECRAFSPRFAHDGEILRIGDLPALQAIATPGHTPGGACYYCREEGFVLTGDTLFQLSMGRTDFPGGDEDAIYASLARLMQLPDGTKVLPGHGPDTTIGFERENNPCVAEALRRA